MAQLDELAERVQRMLNTITENNQFDESIDIELIVDGIAAAHDAILPWVPKAATDTLSAGSTVYQLPADLFEIEAVFDSVAGQPLERLIFQPGVSVPSNYWLPFPQGSISFADELAEDMTLYYTAYWTKPSNEQALSGELDPPEYCLTPMALYATAYVLIPSSVQSAEVRQWNTREDSGNPEHNPLEQSVRFLINMFRNQMDSLPKYQRSLR